MTGFTSNFKKQQNSYYPVGNFPRILTIASQLLMFSCLVIVSILISLCVITACVYHIWVAFSSLPLLTRKVTQGRSL